MAALFGIYAGTGESEAEELMPVTLEELRKVQSAVTEAELARARAQVKASAADVAGKHRQPHASNSRGRCRCSAA